MSVATRFFTRSTIKQIVPLTYIASIILRDLGAGGCAVACKPSWEHTLGEFLIERAVRDCIDFKVTLNEQALKLHGRLKIGRSEEAFNFSAELWCFFDGVKMLVPVFCRISNQMMVLNVVLGPCDPVPRISCQKVRISVLR